MADTCATCRHWQSQQDAEQLYGDKAPVRYSDGGWCRRYPPAVSGDWPATRAIESCGEYSSIPSVPTIRRASRDDQTTVMQAPPRKRGRPRKRP